jgi:hypothetical protein
MNIMERNIVENQPAEFIERVIQKSMELRRIVQLELNTKLDSFKATCLNSFESEPCQLSCGQIIDNKLVYWKSKNIESVVIRTPSPYALTHFIAWPSLRC